jgi:putative two-component system response regulator
MSEDLHPTQTNRARMAGSPRGLPYTPARAATKVIQSRRSILLVDASPERRAEIRSKLESLGHRLLEAYNTSEAIRILSNQPIDLVIADMQIPELGGADLCSVIRSYYGTRSISIFVISDGHDTRQESLVLTSGADDFLKRPLANNILCARVQSVMRRTDLLEQSADFESVLLSLAQAVEARDPAIGRHCHRVGMICSSLGASLGLPSEQIVTMQRGAFLHDIGKIAVPDNILFKRGPLTPEEWSIMQNHTTSGERICSGMKSLGSVLPIIRSHHERWDGTGYPDALKADEIPLLARVIQVADIYDALTTERPYKRAFSPEHALRILKNEAKVGWRDPKVIDAFCDVFPLLKEADALSSSSLLALSAALNESTPRPQVQEKSSSQVSDAPLNR